MYPYKIGSYPKHSEQPLDPQPKLQNINNKPYDNIMHLLTLREANCFAA